MNRKPVQNPKPKQAKKRKASNAISITPNSKKIYEQELSGLQLTQSGTDYVPFFEKGDKYLQFLYFAARTSATHSACVNAKTRFTYGEGVRAMQNGEIQEAQTETIKGWLRTLNAKRETNGKEIKNGIADFFRTGNAFFERAEVGGVVMCYHIKTKNIRILKDYSGCIISNDFFSDRNTISTKNSTFLPLFPESYKDENGVNRSIVHISADKIQNEYYGEPDSVAALVDMALEYRISSWNLSEFDNGFRPSSLMQFVGDYEAEEAMEYLYDMQKKFTGDGNNGKIVMQVVPNKELFANIQQLQTTQDGDFSELAQRVETNILKAHRLPKVLAGIPIAGKLGGDTKEIETAYNYTMNTVIYPVQAEFVERLKEPFFDIVAGDGLDYEIIDNPPITITAQLDVNEILTTDEKRQLLGYAPIETNQIITP